MTRGPVPKRSDQRRRRNHVEIDHAPASADVLGPEPPEWMEGLARKWFESLRSSGQAVYYVDSDWTSAEVVAAGIQAFERRPSAHMLTAILSGFGLLGATEGDRRRLRIELEAGEAVDADEEAAVAALDEWRRRLGS